MPRKNDNTRKAAPGKLKKGSKFEIGNQISAAPLSTNKTGGVLGRSAGAGDDQAERRRRRPQLLQSGGRAQDFGNF